MTIIKAMQLAGIPSLPGYTPVLLPTSSTTCGLILSEKESMSDAGNAQRLIYKYGDRLSYCSSEREWFIWTGKMWEPDEHNQIEVFAQNTARSIIEEVQTVSDPRYKSDLDKWARNSLNHSRFSNMIKVARPQLSVSLDVFDTNKWLLNVDNGTIDLKTGILKHHDRTDLITKICNAKYTPGASSPLWLSFLERIFDGNQEVIRYVQKMLGYMLTGDVSEKCFFILLGPSGNNGKTVFVNVLMRLLADYAVQTPIDTLLQRKTGAQSNDIVALKGARLISAAEANEQHYFDHALVKRLTGNDPITARLLYKEFITFKPEGKIMIATNRVPRFDSKDTAFNNRVIMIPFNVTIPEDEQDKQLEEKLHAEVDGILSWAVEGCQLWQQEGLGCAPASVSPDIVIRPNSSIEHFLATCCIYGDNLVTATMDLYSAYLDYHASMADGSEPKAVNVFGSELTKFDVAADHGRERNVRLGIALKPVETESD